MNIHIDTIYRTIGDLKTVGDSLSRVVLSNPMCASESEVWQIAGLADGRQIGSVNTYKLAVVADGEKYTACGGGALNVDKNYRATGYALELCDLANNIFKDSIHLGYGLSQKSRMLSKGMGSATFNIDRFACIRKSRFFLENYLPNHNTAFKAVLIDIFCFFHRIALKLICAVNAWRLKIETVSADDEAALEDYSRLIASGDERFREDASAAWLKWVLENDFLPMDMARKMLYRASIGGRRVGYCITRYSKEGRLGCIIDWQVDVNFKRFEPWLLMKAAFRLFPRADAVVLAVSETDEQTIKILKRLLIPCSGQMAVVATGDGSPLERHEGWREQKNWRIRPSMGDGAFY